MSKTMAERLRAMSIEEDGCLVWTGSLRRGYGTTWDGKRTLGAHRAAWALANGPIPEGMFVCHHCDNRRCIKVEHLFLGSHKDNMADMAAKGRAQRTNAAKTRCKRGHEFTPENIRQEAGGRRCRQCQREYHSVRRVTLRTLPAENMALTVALAQLGRGEEVMPNIAAVCVLAMGRLAGRVNYEDGDYSIRLPGEPS